MILVTNLKFLVSFFFSKKGLDILLDNVLGREENKAFYSTQRTFQHSKKTAVFQGVSRKFEISREFLFL